MEAGTDKNTPFDKDCQRIENGVITSNDPTSKSEITKMSCGAQFATGFTKVITRVKERRFPVVDEERGMVLSIIHFDHSGKNKTNRIEALVTPVPYGMYTGWPPSPGYWKTARAVQPIDDPRRPGTPTP